MASKSVRVIVNETGPCSCANNFMSIHNLRCSVQRIKIGNRDKITLKKFQTFDGAVCHCPRLPHYRFNRGRNSAYPLVRTK